MPTRQQKTGENVGENALGSEQHALGDGQESFAF
jgi:hypothetical protein